MAKAKRNAIFTALSGTIDDDHYVRTTRDGRTIISLKPDFSNRQYSEAQLDTQSRLKQASAYAKVAYKENPLYTLKTQGTPLTAYNLALADWMKPPVIHSMYLHQGNIVRVSATDNVLVTGVSITVLDPQNQPLEQGEARLELGTWWEYSPTHHGRIRVEACDMAGNSVQREFDNPWSSLPQPVR